MASSQSLTGNGTSAVSAQPQPADYSLPGVMRYLQNEWQRNERDRIQWDLERAEMKTRIAKLEGEKRGLHLLVESHAKKIAILESCIKSDRAKSLNETADDSGDEQKTGSPFDPYLETKALLDKELSVIQSAEVDLTPIIESRLYLEKCIQEVDYLLQSINNVQSGQEKAEQPFLNNDNSNAQLNNVSNNNNASNPLQTFQCVQLCSR